MMTTSPTTRSNLASLAVRLAAAWLLAGAAAKLFLGTPKDLPELVRSMTPFGLDLTFHLVIAVELVIVSLAVFRPSWAWPLLVATFAFFEYVLASQLAAGADSCGCFGASIKVSPHLMMAVDSAVLVFLLATRPWLGLSARSLHPALLGTALAVSLAAPWLVIPSPELTGVSAGSADTKGAAPQLPRYADMSPEKWVRQGIFEIEELTRWVDAEKLPTDGKVVLWRQGCTHCASHLREMAAQDDGSQPIVLIQILDDLQDGRAVDAMPDGAHVTQLSTPKDLQFTIQTPWELRVEGGIVTAAIHDDGAK